MMLMKIDLNEKTSCVEKTTALVSRHQWKRMIDIVLKEGAILAPVKKDGLACTRRPVSIIIISMLLQDNSLFFCFLFGKYFVLADRTERNN